MFITAALLYENERFDQLHLVACGVLVRPVTMYKETDYGSFRLSPADYRPSRVRFLVVCIDGEIEQRVETFRALAVASDEASTEVTHGGN